MNAGSCENGVVQYLEDLALVVRRKVVVLDAHELLVFEDVSKPLGEAVARLLRRNLRVPPPLVREPEVTSGTLS
jgi:hypothetical protein